jgi:tetratricopeptide (TPR) repeat protein
VSIVRRAMIWSLLILVTVGVALGGAFYFAWTGASWTAGERLPAAKKSTLPKLPSSSAARLDLARREPSSGGMQNIFGGDGSLLLRELARQAVLIAARDEMGLATSDETLGDEVDEKGAGALLVDTFSNTSSLRMQLRLGPARESQWEASWKVEGASDSPLVPGYVSLLEQLERLTRTEIPKALAEARFQPAGSGETKAESIDELEKLLDRLSVWSQLEAAQRIHSQEKKVRDQLAVQGMLVRAYANLAMLTHTLWLASSPAFEARALLQAQRMIAREPDSPAGYWHRGYAFAMVGLDQLALNDLAEGKKRAGREEAPAWVFLLEAQCRYDPEGVRSFIRTLPAETDLGYFLLFRSLGGEVYPSKQATDVARDFVEKRHAECIPISRFLCLGFSLGDARQTMRRQEIDLQSSVDHVQDRYQALLGPIKNRKKHFQEISMGLAHLPADRSSDEPSPATVGRLLQDVEITQLADRLRFMSRTWNVPVVGEYQRSWPNVSDHPYSLLLTLAVSGNQTLTDQQKAEVSKLKLIDERVPLYDYLRILDQSNSPGASTSYSKVVFHLDTTGLDFGSFHSMWGVLRNSEMTPRWQMISPHRPLPNVLLFMANPSANQEDIEQITRRFGRHPEGSRLVAQALVMRGKEEEAIESLKLTNESDGSKWGYLTLAEIYRRKGDLEKWRATLDEFLRQPVQTLDHAQARVQIANVLMDQGKFDDAWPYAKSAGETFSSWGLFCAAHCAEGRGDFDTAHELMEACAERYPDQTMQWYVWCIRTGRGDVERARKAFDEQLRVLSSDGGWEGSSRRALKATILGDDEGAAPEWVAAAEDKERPEFKPYYRLMAADCFFATGKREEAVEQLRLVKELDVKKLDGEAFSPAFAEIILRAMDDPNPMIEREQIDALMKDQPTGDKCDCYYLAGRFLLLLGKKEEGKRMLEEVRKYFHGRRWSSAFAEQELRKLAESAGK